MGLLSVLHKKQLAGDKVFTIEITPPKNIDSIAKTVEILDILKDMDLHGLAITNNTGGSFKLNPLDILVYIRRMLGSIPCIVHITSRDEGSVRSIYEHLLKMDLSGVSDILVLRGDPTPGHSKTTDAYKYPTAEMVRIIHEYRSGRLWISSWRGTRNILSTPWKSISLTRSRSWTRAPRASSPSLPGMASTWTGLGSAGCTRPSFPRS